MSSIPEGVKQPQDHKSPAQREAEGVETVEFTFDGHAISLPAEPLDWPTRAIREFERGHSVELIAALLGEKKYQALGVDDWPMRKTERLFKQFAELAGFDDAGE